LASAVRARLRRAIEDEELTSDLKTEAVCAEDVPLFVDLDGTLVRTDTSTEAAFGLIRRNIGYLFILPLWLLRGKAHLKHRVASLMPLEAAELPYREEVVAFLRDERAAGRRLWLATAANRRHADQVAAHLGLFEQVLASDEEVNLEGREKLARMVGLGKQGLFDYAADDLADMAIFPSARHAIVVAPPSFLKKKIGALTNIERVFEPQARPPIDFLRAMRPLRWLMNLLILVPALWNWRGDTAWLEILLGVVSFTLAASGSYLFDDLLHLAERRRLPDRWRGAVAAGHIALQRAGAAVGLFWGLAFALSLFLPAFFSLILGGYVALSVLAVQDWFKLPRLVTAMLLAVSRVAAGAVLAVQPLAFLPCVLGLAAGGLAEAVRRPKLGFL